MKAIDVNNAFDILADARVGMYLEEINAFAKSNAQVAEMDFPGTSTSRYAAVNFRRLNKAYGFGFHFVEREGKVYGYKDEAYKRLLEEIKTSRYADRIMRDVDEISARNEFFAEWDR